MTRNLMPVLERALGEATQVLLRHYGRLERIEKKGEIDLVTVADRESEAVVKRVICDAFPTHQILAEESGEDYGGKSHEYRWIIDPLDGTTNFSHSFPIFSVSIAVERAGEIVAAGIEAPVARERFLAERGGGATLNREPIRVSKIADVASALLVSGFPYDRRERVQHYMDIFGAFLKRAQGVLRLGSAALDLCAVAAGRLDGFWEEKLNPWDTAAGWLIVEEAGGCVTDFSGGKYSPYGKALLATNGLIHDECVAILRGFRISSPVESSSRPHCI